MNEKDYEYLTVLSETGNITRAAEQLYVTQAALSKRIKALEAELGRELFVRGHQGVHLTPAGEIVLKHVSEASASIENMKYRLESMEHEVCGTLRAGIPINYSFYCLPDLLDAYYKKYPRVRLQITTGQSRRLYNMMLEGQLDAAILRGDFTWDGLQYLISQERICIVRNQELADIPLEKLMYIDCNTDANQNLLLSRWMRENNISSSSSSIFMDNIPACMEIVKRGLGWSLVPEIALKDYDGCVTPCYLSNGEPLIRRSYLLCQPYAGELSQIRAFADLLRDMSRT